MTIHDSLTQQPSHPISLKQIYPHLRTILYAGLLHVLGLSPTSSKWDLRTACMLRLLRIWVDPDDPPSVTIQQEFTTHDSGIKGAIWISKVTIPAPAEIDVRDAVVRGIEQLNVDGGTFTLPDVVGVEAEWTGSRAGVSRESPRPDLREEEHYERMMEEVEEEEVTILYFHGGAYFICDPCTHRPNALALAKLTRGRSLSVRYRLAPQNPFPAALLDALVSYLYLLAPPPGSFHAPIPASKIVIAGDSAGGGLAISLLQLLLQLRCSSPSSSVPTVRFHGREVPLDLPAGVSALAPGLDLSRCMPSIQANAIWDYLPQPERDIGGLFPRDNVWPAKPPRGDIYCDTSMLCHPLVSPLSASEELWRGAPPVQMIYGSEMLLDEGKVVARRMARAGVQVVWEEWEAMPHCFPQWLGYLEASDRAVRNWGRFAKDVTSGAIMNCEGKFYEAKTLRERDMDVASLGDLSDEEIAGRMKHARETRPLIK
ncbi:hypothetical protein MMC25_003873 [Agyrium rufum]|nr:hypothetical protein [Agyrium rufum]